MSPIVHRNIRGLFIAILLGAFSAAGTFLRAQAPQEARVAGNSLKIEPQAGAKKIEVTVRLVDTPSITVASATSGSEAASKPIPVAWTSFDSLPPANCAWLVIIDSSNPARRKTIETCVKEAETFLSKLPKGDAVMIASLARDLNVAAGFDSTREQSKTALGTIKPDGDAAQSTLIYQNVKQALIDHLTKRAETRKCVVLLTDGKDETPGDAAAKTARRDELIAEAKKQGIPVHTMGFAEKATEMNEFADIKDVSLHTEGLHVPADAAKHILPSETWETLIGVMHGGGKAVLDLTALTEAAPAQLDLKTASGKTAKVVISKDAVAKALPEQPASKPESGTAASAGAAPSETAKNKTEPEKPALPMWAWGVIIIVALALIIFAIISSKRRAAEEEAKASVLREEQARALEKMLAEPAVPTTAPAPAPLAFLEMCDTTQTRHPITLRGVKVGRGKHNDIVIGNDSVSGSHCVLSLRNDEWTVADLKSGNGVLVNGKQVIQATLHPNDVIELGDIKMRFLLNR
jgi:FHA domain/von Willebrand factor type A domain